MGGLRSRQSRRIQSSSSCAKRTSAARPPGPRADEHHPVAAERARPEPQPAAGVLEVDRQALVPRLREAERVQPGRHLRRAAGGAHDESASIVVLTPSEPAYARHAPAAAAAHEPERLAAVDELDAGQRAHAPAHVAFDERPAPDRITRSPVVGARELVAVDDPAQLLERVARGRAGRRPARRSSPGSSDSRCAQPGGSRPCDVPALRHGSAPLEAVRAARRGRAP